MTTHVIINGAQHYLTPTQYLALEVLGARHRLGVTVWPFPLSTRSALDVLARLGLVEQMPGQAQGTCRARLTDKGVTAVTDRSYKPPAQEKRRSCCHCCACEPIEERHDA